MNRLASETSPYLRQHKDNPVDWYPWGEEAFERAKAENKPVLLSVGYSACHWCHVMAHESFEDPAVAAVMNELFVNIKVDREERPDVDSIYMEAVQALTGQGGWPMTVFLTPDKQPFYGGTYYPNEPRHGMPAFVQVLEAIDEAWKERRSEVDEQAGRLTEALGQVAHLAPASAPVDRTVLDTAIGSLRSQFDSQWGGFGQAPKFPQESSLELLLRAAAQGDRPEILGVVTTTLDAMASGGIYDHLGGGFARYSVDPYWLVPHFEKMLYNQAMLGRVYLHAWQLTHEPRYRQVVEETIGYVLRDLRHADGGLYSAEDADSEGEEGKFYVWRPQEIEDALGADEAPAVLQWWDVTDAGNFEGANILHRPARGDLLRPAHIERARERLFEVRAERVRPGLDDKVLTEWNALFLSTLAEAAAATDNAEWLTQAVQTGEFLLRELQRDDGRWLRAWQDGRANHLAYANDYAALVDAFTRLAEATGEARWITEARRTADAMLDLFWDDAHGGMFTNGRDAEELITRPKDILDSALPSANAVATLSLLRLAALTGDDEYTNRADAILRLLADPMGRQPIAFAHMLEAVDLSTTGATEIVITGDRRDLVSAVQERYLPNAVLAWGERYDSPLFDDRKDGMAYVCRNYTCKLPTDDVFGLLSQLSSPTAASPTAAVDDRV
ncbi:MAG: thioredoxin domain-containing protein [Acidimicrobiia bacterium]|nr:thioredoxin domain-containing protein [Acidimicrobiia bacterium]